MDPVRQAVFTLLSDSLSGARSTSAFSLGADPHAVFDELSAHGVYSLTANLIEAQPPEDRELAAKWLRLSGIMSVRSLQLMAVQSALLDEFKARGIPAAVIKGSASAMYYRRPFSRSMGDIDLLVKRSDMARAAELIEEKGFKRNNYDPSDLHHHREYAKDGVTVEIHRRPGGVAEDNEELIALFERGVDEAETAEMGNFSFPVLPEKLNGLVLLMHINQHIRTGLGLRQIIDWMQFVERRLDNERFEKEYLSLFRSLSLDTLAVSVTALAVKYLGLKTDIRLEADPDTVDELMEYIMDSGNFGGKSDDSSHIASAFTRAKNPFRLLGVLQKSGLKRWAAASRHPILRPFAWAYQLKESLRAARKQKLTVSKLKRLSSEGMRQRALIEKLGLDYDNKLH